MTTIFFNSRNCWPVFTNTVTNLTAKKSWLLVLCCLVLNLAQSQMDKRLLLADQYYAAGEYLTAASLYGQFLNPAKKEKPSSDFPLNSKKTSIGRTGNYANRLAITYKQAESYRLANYAKDAADLYKKCFDKDSAKYADALYWSAVCQRSAGNYGFAEESVNQFLNHYAAASSYQQLAEKEKATLQFIKRQLTRPDTSLYHIQKINAPVTGGVYAPMVAGKSFFITTTQSDSMAQPGVNPNHNRLFSSELSDKNLANLQAINIEGLDASLNQGTACISANGNYIYFTQWRKENGRSVSSIYFSEKKENGWGQPQLLSSVNEASYNSKQPFCTADGRYLFFASDRTGSVGGFDIWYAPVQPDGTTGTPLNAGPVINTLDNEQAPFYQNTSHTLVFASDRNPGMGGYDLFAATGKENEWKLPENLGYPINSSRDDIYFFAQEKEDLLANAFFSSDRGSECCLSIYQVSKTAKKKILTGTVLDCKSNEPIADADITMKDSFGAMVKARTDRGGKYSFELSGGANQHQMSAAKDKYNETVSSLTIEGQNEKGWFEDTLYAGDLCLEKKQVLIVENVVSVYFDFDQSKLKERSMQQLDSIYIILTENPKATLQISGYTDGRGSEKYNKLLSDKRAKSCADYLIQKGLDPARISFESFGSCCPVEMELINGRDNPDGRSLNRRALINIVKS